MVPINEPLNVPTAPSLVLISDRTVMSDADGGAEVNVIIDADTV
jgi:hypothetical protein